MNASPPDDTQRELEQRALRNVRGLVDKMEGLDAQDSRAQKRYLVAIVLGAVVLFSVLAGALWFAGKRNHSEPVVIDPAKLPPIKPGPP